MSNVLSMYRLITRLSSRDFKKNVHYNIYHLITITVLSVIIYGINALTANNYVIRQIPYYDVENILILIRIGAIFFYMLAIGVVVYINNYLFNNQKKKYYLLRTMGVSRGIISYKIFFEQFIATVIGGIFGIIIGGVFNFFLTKYILEIMEASVNNSFRIYGDAFLLTVIELLGLLLFTYFKNIGKFKTANVKSLLQTEKKIPAKGQETFALKIIILSIIVIATLGIVVYYNSIRHFKDVSENTKNFLLVGIGGLFIIGLCCITVLLVDIKIRRRKTGKYASAKELVLLTELTAYAKRMKYMIFMSSMILLISIITPAMANIFQIWSESFNQYKGDLDIEINSIYNSIKDPKEIPEIEAGFIQEYLLDQGITIKEMVKIENYIADSKLFMNRKRGTFPPYLITLSDYNHAREISGLQMVNLQEGEFLVHKHKTERNSYIDEIVLSNGVVLKNSGQEYTDSVGGESIFNNDNNYVIVVNDKQINGLLKVSETLLIDTEMRLSYDEAIRLEESIINTLNEYNEEIYMTNNTGDEYYALFSVDMGTVSNNQYVTFTILLRLLALYLFVIGMILTLSILSLNYLFIMGFHLKNIKIYRRVGIGIVENEYIRRKETFYIYSIPLLCSGICTILIFGIYISINYNELSVFVSVPAVILGVCKYFLVLLLMTYLYAIITKKSTKKREEKEYER